MKIKPIMKKILSGFFALCVGLSSMPYAALAAGETDVSTETVNDVVYTAYYEDQEATAVDYVGSEAEVEIPTSIWTDQWYCINTIGGELFDGCDDVTKVTLSARVETIEEGALSGTSLDTLVMKGIVPPVLEGNIMPVNTAGLLIYVPAGFLETYQQAEGWSDYADHMRESDPITIPKLIALSVTNGDIEYILTPKFDSDVTEYRATVDADTESVYISGEATEDYAFNGRCNVRLHPDSDGNPRRRDR